MILHTVVAKVPALVDGDFKLWEAAAITQTGRSPIETLVKAKYNLGPPDLARTEAASRIGGRRNSRFTNYSRLTDWHMQPAWLDGREVLAVLKAPGETQPLYFIEIMTSGNRIATIRDFHHVPNIAQDAAMSSRDRSGCG